jgi:hypothetical protein
MEIQHHHQNPVTAIVQHVERDVKKIELPLEKVEHKVGHIEESIDKTISEKKLSLEESFVDRLLKDPNTEKLIKYTLNSPDAKKIFEDIAQEKIQQLREELGAQVKNLENQYSQDFKKLICAGVGITIVLIGLALYS